MEKWQVTIKDVLSRELFKGSKVIAGSLGLDREVKWTHILETGDFESFINGGELILTTGSGIQFDSIEGVTYLEKLRKKNIAGICIELGTHVQTIHPDIIKYGDTHHIPLIIFDKFVKFVDITQDLHTLIINHHHQMLHQLNLFSKTVNELSLTPNGILKILKELYMHLNIPTILITDDAKSFYYPPEAKVDIPFINTVIEKYKNTNKSIQCDKEITIFPVNGLGHSWGNLILTIHKKELDNFSLSITDRAILAIKQIMLRNRVIEERKQNQEEEIIRNLIHGKECDVSDIQKILPAPATNLNYRLFLIKNQHILNEGKNEDWEEIKLQQSIMVRSLFRSHGFLPSLYVSKNEMVVIASFYKHIGAKNDKERFTKIIEEIKNIQERSMFSGKNCIFGISNVKHDYFQLNQSYKEANDVILIQSANILQTNFFENLGVYRILLEQSNHQNLEEYVYEYLGPILQYDCDTNSHLLETLSVYLNCLGSKKEAADQLFIVRQTLYHRLEKIEDLLGADFMEPVKRQAIELALAACALLNYRNRIKE